MNPVRFPISAVGFMLCSFVSLAQLTGNLTTVNESGTPQDVFSSKDDVFFTIGPTATPCAATQFANDGQYYFQVTDLAGTHLLSTDPLSERIVTVLNGVLFFYDGHTHETDTVEGIDEQTGETVLTPEVGPCDALSVGLAPFADAGGRDAAYLLWLMPVGRFTGDPSQVDPACGAGCFHGFLPEFSRTHAFRVEDKRFCEEAFCVSGVKFEDRNGDGLRDSGEPGLPGVVIHVESEDGSFLNGLTSPDGSFQICGLHHGGTFRVTEDVPFGYRQTGPLDDRPERRLIASDFGYFVVLCDENFSGLDFGNQLIPNAIGGIKFEDLNANGVRDPGEPGLAGFTINLTPASPGTPPVGTTTTDANGNFIFLDVAPGTYTLSEVMQPGFSLTVPALNSITVTLAAGGSSIANEFGNFRGVLTGTISGAKFNDLNGNGVRDAGEPGLAGVTITRTASVNDPVGTNLSVVTDAQGNFSFATVPFGSFTISETVPAGFVQTFPGLPGTISTNVNFDQRDVTGLLFGNRAVGGSVSGVKFNDLNGNGVRDADEPGLSAVTIRLTDASNVVRTTTTDASGAFAFTNVTAGAYVVSEVVPNGFTQTAPAAPGTFAITVTTGQPVTNLLFGNRASQGPTETGSISGRKILDFEGNGIVDGNDRGFEGIVFELRDSNGSLVATATSDAQGNFTFANVPLGTYVLSEILPQNFFQTFPGSPQAPGTYTITLTTDQRNPTGFLFLNKC
jgi:serine-aspartate repeat-containing protein C/D/E